jgi:hypothetical protein
MGLLRDTLNWFVRTVRETVPHERIPIELERNRDAVVEMGAKNPPDMPLYRFRLGLRAGFSGEARATIPVFRRVNPNPHPVLKEIFYCEIAGTVAEAANVEALREKTARMLETLAPGKSLPLAYFRVPAVDYSLPVYEDDGRIVCPVIVGSKLKAKDLATMRGHVFRYLVGAGYVTDHSQVELWVLRPSDFRLVPPAAIITSVEEPDLWFPTVEGRSQEGSVIGVLGEGAELRTDEHARAGFESASGAPAATDVTALLRLIGTRLAESGRIESPFDLHAGEVRPEIWARTERVTDDVGRRLTCWLETEEVTKLELPLRRTAAGELVTALQDQGICVFVAADEPELAGRVGRYLSRHGFLRWQDAVEVVAEEAARGPSDQLLASGEIEFPRKEIEFSRLEFGEPSGQPGSASTEENAFEDRKNEEEVRFP